MVDNRVIDGGVSGGPISKSASLLLKGMAILLLYVLIGHPSAYFTLWERKNWYVLLLAVPLVPLLLIWCVQVLVWRIRINATEIEIRSLRGVLKRQIAEISRIGRDAGRLLLVFNDGSRRSIPAIVGDLDELLNEIETRRRPTL